MQEIKLIVKTLGIFILLFEIINVSYYFKAIFKRSQSVLIHPWDCVLCMTFWSGIIAYFTPDLFIYEISLILLIAIITEKIWNRI